MKQKPTWILMTFLVFMGLLMSTSDAYAKNKQDQASAFGSIDLAPSWNLEADSFHTENSAELGVQINPNTKLSYVQYVDTNLHDPENPDRGLDPTLNDGFLKAKFMNLWVSKDELTSFDYEPRIYFPIHKPKREAGMITIIRNNFKVKRKLSKGATFSVIETPILHIYNKAGHEDTANRIFENRVQLGFDVDLSSKWSLSLPLQFFASKYRDFEPQATLNGEWDYFLGIYPELSYAVSSSLSLGIAYYSKNFLASETYGLTLAEDPMEGVVQFLLSISL